ncbi:hypothetical protein [Rheinheimera soli]|uniref:Uncharacterized protein n=1 Tax=Rheinheimera soli TaxID=443616 RepID=A0ABU1VYQ7_9GAMM|nr:hypothetical protein [Rheinheimera soli]MDR7120827.1 hypothetical protein [Rheinheimera soli]
MPKQENCSSVGYETQILLRLTQGWQMKKISIYRTLILALLIFTVIGLKLKITEPVILLLTLSPFLTALLLSLSSGFSTQPARIVAFSLPSLLFFFFAFYPWFVRREYTVASSSTSVLDFIHFPITACVIGFASLALFEIFTAIVSEEADNT